MDYKVLEDENLRLDLCISVHDDYYYNIFDKDNNYVGNCGIRLSKDPYNFYLGNIEYEIFSPFRGNRYGEKASRLLLLVAQNYHINNICITANSKNFASIKTITSLGGKFIEVVRVPKGTRLYKNGNRLVARYDVDTKESRK